MKNYRHLAIIDADSVPYRCSNAAIAKGEDFETACRYVDNLFYEILKSTGCTEYIAFYTGRNNYRNNIYESYKEGRNYEDTRKGYFYEVKEYARKRYEIYTVHGIEADDACLTFHQCYPGSVLCSRDKDLKQSEGLHYLYNGHIGRVEKLDKLYITDSSKKRIVAYGEDKVWVQMLTGDSSDGIKGIPGVGPVKAYNILSNSYDYRTTVYKQYISFYGYKLGKKHFITNYKLLKIMKVDKLNRLDIRAKRFYQDIIIKVNDKSGEQDEDLLVPVPTLLGNSAG